MTMSMNATTIMISRSTNTEPTPQQFGSSTCKHHRTQSCGTHCPRATIRGNPVKYVSSGIRRWVKSGSVWDSAEKKEGRGTPSVSSNSVGLPQQEAGVTLRLGRNWQVAEADQKLLLQIFNKLTQLMKVAPHDFRVIQLLNLTPWSALRGKHYEEWLLLS